MTNESLHPALEGLSPKQLWQQFDGLRKQPRPSMQEHQAVKWVCDWADANVFEWKKDSIGNVCIKVPASEGATSTQTICLQGHIDMVCTKDDGGTHNFETDPIELRKDGNLLKANRTTLGADNGIGISAMMAAATDADVEHPAMEILLTVDEEDGFSGVDNLDPKALGMESTKVVNLDTEMLGELVVKSAGFHGVEGQMRIERIAESLIDPNGNFVGIDISGFKGGHSGLDIEKGRGNPILSMSSLLKGILPQGSKLVSFDGGLKDNVIPTTARAVVYFPGFVKPENVEPVITKFYKDLTETFEGADLNLFSEVSAEEKKVGVMTIGNQRKILNVLSGMPNGVLEMHDKLPGVVGVSSNIGAVSTTVDSFAVKLSARAFADDKLQEAVDNAKVVFDEHGFTSSDKTVIGGWDGNPDSPLAKATFDAYKVATDGSEPKVTGANCGLEVADVVKKLKAHLALPEEAVLDGVSFGPSIHSVHSPDENLEIDTVDIFYKQLKALLGHLAKTEV